MESNLPPKRNLKAEEVTKTKTNQSVQIRTDIKQCETTGLRQQHMLSQAALSLCSLRASALSGAVLRKRDFHPNLSRETTGATWKPRQSY